MHKYTRPILTAAAAAAFFVAALDATKGQMSLGVGLGVPEYKGGVRGLPPAYPPPDIYANFLTGEYRNNFDPNCVSLTTCFSTERASLGWSVGSDGIAVQFANNVPRLTDFGLRVEETRVNRMSNNANTGATVGTPGNPGIGWVFGTIDGIDARVVATPTIQGISCIDLGYSGNAIGNLVPGMTGNATGTVANQPFTLSGYLALVGGSATNVGQISIRSNFSGANGNVIATVPINASELTGNLQRVRPATYFTAASDDNTMTQPVVQIGVNGAVDFVIRVCGLQLEAGRFPSSYMRTAGGQFTRQVDRVRLITVPAIGNGAGISMFGSAAPDGPATASATATIAAISDDGLNQRFQLQRAATSAASLIVYANGSSTTVTVTGSSWPGGSSHNFAASMTLTGNKIAVYDGGPSNTGTGPFPNAAGLTSIMVGTGSAPNSGGLEGNATGLQFWASTVLTLEELTAVTQP